MDINEILGKAFNIAQESNYEVHFHDIEGFTKEKKEMTYIELGLFLVGNKNNIKEIHIYAKKMKNILD